MKIRWLLGICAAGLMGFAGCGGEEVQPERDEMWLFQRANWGDIITTVDITHNYQNAQVPSTPTDTSEWTRNTTDTFSDELFFGQIIDFKSGDKLLVAGNEVFPGKQVGASWSFTWTGSERTREEESHDEGYVFVDDDETTMTITYDVAFSGPLASGTVKWERVTTKSWQEKDEWPVPGTVDPTPASGQTPINGLIVKPGPTVVENLRTVADCLDSICQLNVVSTEAREAALNGTLTELSEEGVYRGTAGQPAGID